MYGEDQQSHLRRLLDRNAPAQLAFDDQGLQRLYSATLNPATDWRRTPPPPQWKKSELTSQGVKGLPGRTPMLDPVADAERMVWRDVPREVEVGTYDLGDLDLGNLGRSEVTSLRNILGWDAIKQVDGKWKATGVSDQVPVGHPLMVSLFGDLKERGAHDIRVETRTFKDPKGPPIDVQRSMLDEELAPFQGALYVHTNDMTAFAARATDAELAALDRAMERFPMRERTRTVGKNQVEDIWFPVDPADPDITRLLERAKGGGAALFDGVTGQPTLSTQLPTKSNPNLPSPKEFSDAVRAAYTNPEVHPSDFLNKFLTDRGMSEVHKVRLLEQIGDDWAAKAGLNWRPSDTEVVRYMTQRNTQGRSGMGARGTTAVTAQRQEISEMYAGVLGEIEAFSKRITSQAATVNGVVQDIRKYLLDNDLIETVHQADGPTMRGLHTTAGLRVVSENQARALGNGFTGGEIIPAEIHRILLEQVDTAKGSPLGLAWQWFGSRWTGKNLANPSSISTNITSAFVMADQAGHSIPGLLRGIHDYLSLHRAAVRGDGALDTATKVAGVNMRELFDHGAFTHNTLMNVEVHQRSNRLMDELANPVGSPLQQKVAALQEWLTETEKGAKAAALYGKASAVPRWFGDMYGRVDSVMKGGLYMAQRRQGIAPEQAARIADETFFNYENVPYVVDGLRRWGLLGVPYASFKFLAAGRFMRSLYQNPYGVHKYYRLDDSSKAAMADQEGEEGNGKSALAEYEEGSPEYVRAGLYLPAGVDSEGRRMAVRLDSLLPETAVFDAFNADGVAGTLPPAVQLAAQLVTGKGYQGRDVYRTGEMAVDTWKLDKREAIRGAVKHLWQFGTYSWMPGQPMTERIVKAVADSAVPVETIANPVAQNVLKILSEGPTGVPLPGVGALDQSPWSPEKKGSQPVPDVEWALARVLGVKAYPITTTTSQPGSMRSNKQGLEAQLQTLDKMMRDEMRSALTPQQQADVRRRYDRLREPLIRKLRGE